MASTSFHLALEYDENIPKKHFDRFLSSIQCEGLDLRIRNRPPLGAQMSLKWLVPTAMVFFVAENYFDGFLKEAGKDHYLALRDSVSVLWSDYYGAEDKPNVHYITPGKVEEYKDTYSPLFSIMYKIEGSFKIKFLFREDYSKEEFEAAYKAYLDLLSDISNNMIDAYLIKDIEENPPLSDTILITYSPSNSRLMVVNPVPENVRKKMKHNKSN